MKKIILAVFVFVATIRPAVVFSQDKLPKPAGVVSDFAGVLDDKTKQEITELINEVDQKTSDEIAVVTVKSIGDDTVEGYSNRLFSEWRPGKKGKDNGILFLTSVNDHKARIEVGYGLEGIIPDGKAGRILDDYVLPNYKQDDYNKGVMLGTIAIAQIIAQDAKVSLDGKYDGALQRQDDNDVVLRVVLLVFFVVFVPILSWIGRKRGRYRGGPGGYMGGGFGGGFGGGGGGFGGFGGGFGGGGGASRGW